MKRYLIRLFKALIGKSTEEYNKCKFKNVVFMNTGSMVMIDPEFENCKFIDGDKETPTVEEFLKFYDAFDYLDYENMSQKVKEDFLDHYYGSERRDLILHFELFLNNWQNRNDIE